MLLTPLPLVPLLSWNSSKSVDVLPKIRDFKSTIFKLSEKVFTPAILCVPVVLTTVLSTCISSAFAVIPSPPITLSVTAPELPPPVKPVPAVTASMSAELSFLIVTVFPLFVTVTLVPPTNVSVSPLLIASAPALPVSVFTVKLPKLSAVVDITPVLLS